MYSHFSPSAPHSKDTYFGRKVDFPSQNKNILVTGGAGYIGTHTIVCLLEEGYDVTVFDNLVNSSEEGLNRVKLLTCISPDRLKFLKVDLCKLEELDCAFSSSPKFGACIHFAGLKAVGESVYDPLLYYNNNLNAAINLLKSMSKYNCHSIVFSSSATVGIFIYFM